MALGDKLPVVMGREKAAPSGVATLGADGILAEAQRPGLAQIKGGSNSNLIINWDFRNPVNRNGKTEYPATGSTGLHFTFDLWALGSSALTIKDGYANLSTENAVSYKRIIHPTSLNLKANRAYTLSILARVNAISGITTLRPANSAYGVIPSATGKQLKASDSWDITAYTFTAQEDVPNCCIDLLTSNAEGSWIDVDIMAWKLELGDHQTLARKNEDGEWEIIDPPDYDLQYLLCSQYSPSTGEWVGSQHSNPTLLDNGYFVGGGSQQGGGQFPINQRGQTEYVGVGYTIDRWSLNVDRGTLTVNDGYITLTNAVDSGAEYLRQAFEHEFKTGDILTLSFLIRGNAQGQVFFGNRESGANTGAGTTTFTASAGWEVVSVTVAVGSTLPRWAVIQITGKNTHIDILAAKLELGPVQTLAHKEGDTWVLNDPPPNYQQELAKCQRSQVLGHLSSIPYVKSGSDYLVFLPLPVPLRAIPTIIGKPNVYNVSNSAKATGATVAVKRLDKNGVILTVSNVNEPCVVYFGPEADIGLDANL